MDETLKKELFNAVDESVAKNLKDLVGPEVTAQVEKTVQAMRLERKLIGRDISGVDDETKIAFVEEVRTIARGEKAAHYTFSDQDGGYLVSTDLYDGILRIAATSGLVARDARKFGVSGDELEVPRYTGSVLQGEFLGEEQEGDETKVDIGVTRLFVKNWQVIFRLTNNLIADARVDVADWLMALAAEGLAYRLDREGFVGGTYAGSPFVGLLATNSEVPAHTMASSHDAFEDFGIADASDVIAAVPTSAVSGAAFYFHRTVWGKIRQRNASGVFEFGSANNNLATLRRENGIQPVGEILGYPVYTTDVLPAFSSSAASTKFGFFGDLSQVLAWADKGPMSIAKSDSATVGGVNLFRANQIAYRMTYRFGIGQLLPSAGAVIKTAAN